MSFVPKLFKVNSIKNLVFRAFSICHNWLTFDKEIGRFKQYFTSNGYPLHLFETTVKRLLYNRFTQNLSSNKTAKEIKYITLPFH